MRLLLFAALLIPAAAPAAPFDGRPIKVLPGPDRSASCPTKVNHHAWRRGEPQRPRKLTELPRAEAYAAVLRHIDGCDAPLVLTRSPRDRR